MKQNACLARMIHKLAGNFLSLLINTPLQRMCVRVIL